MHLRNVVSNKHQLRELHPIIPAGLLLTLEHTLIMIVLHSLILIVLFPPSAGYQMLQLGLPCI